jgi:hypothetical protein
VFATLKADHAQGCVRHADDAHHLLKMLSLSADELGRRIEAMRLTTDAVSLVSHAHGRQRRTERMIEKIELQAAVKHGKRERAHPGRDGTKRWRFEHNGVVYITDETCRHEITSWRIDDESTILAVPKFLGGTCVSSHTVLIVDSSGSMRSNDVPGYVTRTQAVYEAVLRDFVQPQLELSERSTAVGKAVVTLISMGERAEVLLERAAIDADLLHFFRAQASSRARSHGNYLPALQLAKRVLLPDLKRQVQLFVVVLSDGAPSDHISRSCRHGVAVWQPDELGRKIRTNRQIKPMLQNCVSEREAQTCRVGVRRAVHRECVQHVNELGDLFGRERVSVHTVAFGDPKEDYSVLEQIGTALPRGSFQKLGLAAANLRTAFVSINSSLTLLRTDGGGSGGMTRRLVEETANRAGWNVYVNDEIVSKEQYDPRKRVFVPVPLGEGAQGVAVYSRRFAEGAERCAFRCVEVSNSVDGLDHEAVGGRLVAKETLYEEQLISAKFHKTMAKTQAEAELLAVSFNARARRGPSQQLHFVDTVIYEVRDATYAEGRAWILAEPELEGTFVKWNNNVGAVLRSPKPGPAGRAHDPLGAIGEDDEEEEDSRGVSGASDGAADLGEIPQCFSHFTWSVTNGDLLVCDLQGVWNAVDGYALTDPAMHRVPRGERRRRGLTDKGAEGIDAFFRTHTCGPLCSTLGLKRPASASARG